MKQFYQTGEARPLTGTFRNWTIDHLFQVTDHVEAFVTALKRTEPTVAGVGVGAATSSVNPSQPVPWRWRSRLC